MEMNNDSKRTGWFSRRHRTAAALLKSKTDKAKNVKSYFDSLHKREAARKNRSDKEQLELLDERLGKGIGAKKERARLQKRIDAS